MHKTADLVIEIPAGRRKFWATEMHEPLLLGLTLPFFHSPPWQFRQSERILVLARELQDLWKDPGQDERVVLRQLSELPRTLESL